MNSMAVALAADSAVTVRIGNSSKIFNSANKLFSLSKYAPVGVMIYGDADLMALPWETLIKVHRERLGRRVFPTLEEYASDLLNFVENQTYVSQDITQQMITQITRQYYANVLKEIEDTIGEAIKVNSPIDVVTKQAVKAVIENTHDGYSDLEFVPGFDQEFVEQYVNSHRALLTQISIEVFGELPLDADLKQRLARISAFVFCKNDFFRRRSGLVVAGFGENEIYPSILAYEIDCHVGGRLVYRKNSRKCNVFEVEGTAVMAFAQEEVVHSFIEGIDPYLKKSILDDFGTILMELPNLINEQLAMDLNGQDIEPIVNMLVKKYAQNLGQYVAQNHVRPILSIVDVLPKEELAAMAETLVNLTSFKRRVSTDEETVGGPIDVAVISKGDGFIWIKRKHYFRPELNHQFFENYNRGSDNDGNEGNS